MTTECTQCGRQYQLMHHHLPVREQDNLVCDFCGEELISWHGAFAYTAKLIWPPLKLKIYPADPENG